MNRFSVFSFDGDRSINANAAVRINPKLCTVVSCHPGDAFVRNFCLNRLTFRQAPKQSFRFLQTTRQVSVETATDRLRIIPNQHGLRWRRQKRKNGHLSGSIGRPCLTSSSSVSVPRILLSSSNSLSGSSSRRSSPAAIERPVRSGSLEPDPFPSESNARFRGRFRLARAAGLRRISAHRAASYRCLSP